MSQQICGTPPAGLRSVAIVVISLLALALGGPPVAAQSTAGDWNVYLDGNEIRALTSLGNEVYAATSGGAIRYTPALGFVQWNREPRGLLSDSLQTVAVDASGLVWFGTERVGLSQFDPVTARWFPFTALLEPIPGNAVRKLRILQRPEGELVLVGTPVGFSVFLNGDLRFVCQQGVDICEIPSFDVRDLTVHGSRIFIATAAGTVALEEDGTFSDISAGLDDQVLRVFTTTGDLVGASARQVFRWNGLSWSDDSGGLPPLVDIRDLLRAGDDLYLATDLGIYHRTAGGWARLGAEAFPATSLVVTDDGTLYAGVTDPAEVRNGLWIWDGVRWTQRHKAGPSPRAHYRRLRFDAAGDLWFSTAQNGRLPLVGRRTGTSWDTWTAGAETAVNAWTFDIGEAFGRIWFAHCCCRFDGDCRVESISLEDEMFDAVPGVREAWRFDVDPDGNLWLCTNADASVASGLWRIENDFTARNFSPASNPELKGVRVSAIRFEGRRLWIGYPGSGASLWSFGPNGRPDWEFHPETGESQPGYDDTWVHFDATDPPRLIGASISEIRVAEDGNVWIATTAGLSIFDGGTFSNIGPAPTRFASGTINDVLPTADGGAWVASAGSGLTRMDYQPATDDFRYETFLPPLLPNPNVNTLALDPDGTTVWAGTTRGLASFRPRRTVIVDDGADRVGLYPNPLRPGCVDGVRVLGADGQSSGVVVDLAGRRLASFEARRPGEVIWDGRFDGGAVAPGLYIVQLRTPRGTESVGLSVLESDCGP